MKKLFYRLKLKEEKQMLINIASAVIEDEVNKQFTICFFDGSIVQYDKRPQAIGDLRIADSVRFINDLEPELTRDLIHYLKPQKRGDFVDGAIRVNNTFADGSCFSL